jgi:Predicted membrane protein
MNEEQSMNETATAQPSAPTPEPPAESSSLGEVVSEAERNMVLIAYICYAVSAFTGFSSIIGVIINHIKLGESKSRFARSHHRWMMRTFWFGLLGVLIGALLSAIGIGLVVIVIVGIWYIYRIVRGFIYYGEGKPMPMPT